MLKRLFLIILICSFSLTACSAQKAVTPADNTASETAAAVESSVETADSSGETTDSSSETNESSGAEAMPSDTAESAEAESTDQDRDPQIIPDIEAGILMISKYGNVVLTISPESMIELGYEPADMISVRIGGAEMEMPIGTSYTDADSGEPVCRYKTDSNDPDSVIMAINAGNLAETMGFAECHLIDADPGFEWTYLNGLDESVTVYISMLQKQGYADEYNLHKVGNTRTNNRNDYPGLSDAEYANFRVIETTGMGAGVLYRSSSPVNPSLNRNQEADQALLDAQIRTVINMADTESKLKQFPDFSQSNYADCDITALDMSMDFSAEDNRQKLAEGFRFMISHDGPYLIHCVEGKDRTGFAAAVLECFMGADIEEIVSDYMLTFYNYYGMEPGTAQYEQVAASNIEATLAKAFGVNSIREENTDLQACAEAYLQDIGMSVEEISALKDRLGQ